MDRREGSGGPPGWIINGDINPAHPDGLTMATRKSGFTDIQIRSLKPTAKQYKRFDGKIPGFGIRVSPGGTKSFVLIYRIGGEDRRLTLGRYPVLPLAEARTKVVEALKVVNEGRDPAADKRLRRDTYQSKLFATAIDDFIEIYAKRRTRRWRETARILKKEFRHLDRRSITDINRQEINDVLDKMVQQGKLHTANQALAAVRKFCNWAVERGYLESSPCAGIKAPAKVMSRERVLSHQELSAVWTAAGQIPSDL